MLEGIRAIRLESISGDFSPKAEILQVRQIMVHNYLLKPCFSVDKVDRDNPNSQRGILHLSMADLVAAKLPDQFDLKSIGYIQFQKRTIFPVAAKIGSIELGKGAVIGARTKIGREVSIGEETLISVDCRIECSRIGKQVVVRRCAMLANVVIGDHTELGPEVVIDNRGLGFFEIGSWVRIEGGIILRGQNIAYGTLVKSR